MEDLSLHQLLLILSKESQDRDLRSDYKAAEVDGTFCQGHLWNTLEESSKKAGSAQDGQIGVHEPFKDYINRTVVPCKFHATRKITSKYSSFGYFITRLVLCLPRYLSELTASEAARLGPGGYKMKPSGSVSNPSYTYQNG